MDPVWEEVVEASYRPLSDTSLLVQWAAEDSWTLGLEEADLRVRYCARGMDEAHEADTRGDAEAPYDHYLLQFWPAPPAPDRILKQTARIAAYWHGYAAEQPLPPTPAERAEAERRARLTQGDEERERLLAHARGEWGGRLPSRALRQVGGNVQGLLPFDPALVHALDDAGPPSSVPWPCWRRAGRARWPASAAWTGSLRASPRWTRGVRCRRRSTPRTACGGPWTATRASPTVRWPRRWRPSRRGHPRSGFPRRWPAPRPR
ncbi:hypothetical protein [Streptomyces sp. SAI-170]|uniref:hypothetical protein n=1 Tax=Streptomyces sp. SAI-170 TaxID=3377729 RepID=UPI003C7CBA67